MVAVKCQRDTNKWGNWMLHGSGVYVIWALMLIIPVFIVKEAFLSKALCVMYLVVPCLEFFPIKIVQRYDIIEKAMISYHTTILKWCCGLLM